MPAIMATPKENTEVVRMLREVKDSIWKSFTPMRDTPGNLSEYIPSLNSGLTMRSGSFLPNVATKLNFSSMDDSQTPSDSSFLRTLKTPDSLKRKLMNTEIELQATKAKLMEKESRISVMEPVNKKICVSLESKLQKYMKQSEIDSQKAEELRIKLKWTKGELMHAKNRILEVERQKKIDVDKLELKILSLQQDCSNLKIEVADIKSERAEAVRNLNLELGRLELKVSMMSEEARKSEDFIQTLKRQNEELTNTAALSTALQKELEEAQERIKALENKIEADKDAALIVSSRQSDLKLLGELQKENRILKENMRKSKENNVALFQEKLWSYQEKLAQAEKKIAASSKLQAENELLKTKIAQWEDLFDDKATTPLKSPSMFSRKLSQYQKNEAILTNKLSQATNHCETLEKQKSELEETVQSLNRRLQQLQMNSPLQDTVIRRLQRKVTFLTKERDNCRKLLDSYLSESTMSGVVLNANHINYLEEMNSEYKKALEKSEKEVDSLNEKFKTLMDNNSESVTSEIKKLRVENCSHLTLIAELQKENSILQTKCSEQNMKKESAWAGKILHLRFNPLDNANQKHLELFKKLQEENDHLKKRIQVLEEEGATASDVTMKVQQKLASEGSDSTLKSLQEKLASAERQQRFILENARIKSTEFREAVYRLTGYRVDVPTAETYKLSHVYAESRDDFLIFKINSQGIQLVETEYSKHLTEKMELYLHQYDSFPAFLASVTMDLFNQQTCIMGN